VAASGDRLGSVDAPAGRRYDDPALDEEEGSMTRTIHCKRLKREAPGLAEPPMFGKVGKEIFEHVSQEAWDEWQEMQLKIVNEYRLDLADKEARRTLTKQMRIFLGLDEAKDGDEGVLDVGTPTEER
jgi:Fe-S cluster biosynthesis and repair protein YggX